MEEGGWDIGDGGDGNRNVHRTESIHMDQMFIKPAQWRIYGGGGPTAQNFFNFMQFFAKFGKFICWRLPGGLAPPPTGNTGSAPAASNII